MREILMVLMIVLLVVFMYGGHRLNRAVSEKEHALALKDSADAKSTQLLEKAAAETAVAKAAEERADSSDAQAQALAAKVGRVQAELAALVRRVRTDSAVSSYLAANDTCAVIVATRDSLLDVQIQVADMQGGIIRLHENTIAELRSANSRLWAADADRVAAIAYLETANESLATALRKELSGDVVSFGLGATAGVDVIGRPNVVAGFTVKIDPWALVKMLF